VIRMSKTPLEAAQKYETRCDIVYESFLNTQNEQFMNQIEELSIDIGFLISYVKNYYGEVQSNEIAARYAVLAQAKINEYRDVK